MREDIRFENVPPEDLQVTLTKNMFEFVLKDEFLPIYTHQSYARIFKESSMVMEMSPGKSKWNGKRSQMSPGRMENSTISKRSSQM